MLSREVTLYTTHAPAEQYFNLLRLRVERSWGAYVLGGLFPEANISKTKGTADLNIIKPHIPDIVLQILSVMNLSKLYIFLYKDFS